MQKNIWKNSATKNNLWFCNFKRKREKRLRKQHYLSWLLVSVAASEQESSNWSQWMMLDISSWTTQSMMRLKLVSTMWYGEQKLTTECIENVIMMMPFSAVVMWSFEEMIGNRWKKILWQSGKIAFIFSVSIEMLQLLLRLGTFQRSDIFYNTVGGVLGGLMYCAVVKARKRL